MILIGALSKGLRLPLLREFGRLRHNGQDTGETTPRTHEAQFHQSVSQSLPHSHQRSTGLLDLQRTRSTIASASLRVAHAVFCRVSVCVSLSARGAGPTFQFSSVTCTPSVSGWLGRSTPPPAPAPESIAPLPALAVVYFVVAPLTASPFAYGRVSGRAHHMVPQHTASV